MSERVGALRSRWIDVEGRPIHARVSAQPTASGSLIVVLVHGMGVSSRYLIPTAQRLAPDYDIAAPDLPGFGLSGHPDRVLDVPGLADALAAWMRAARIARAALLGNSFGCQIIADLAARYPELVERVVLQGPTIPPEERTVFWQIVRWRQNGAREPSSLTPIVLHDYWDCGLSGLFQTFRFALQDRIEEKLPQIEVPALVVRGGRDPMCPQHWAEWVARLLPQGRLKVIPGGPHTLVYTMPLELVRVVRPFLDEARPAGKSSDRIEEGQTREPTVRLPLRRGL